MLNRLVSSVDAVNAADRQTSPKHIKLCRLKVRAFPRTVSVGSWSGANRPHSSELIHAAFAALNNSSIPRASTGRLKQYPCI